MRGVSGYYAVKTGDVKGYVEALKHSPDDVTLERVAQNPLACGYHCGEHRKEVTYYTGYRGKVEGYIDVCRR